MSYVVANHVIAHQGGWDEAIYVAIPIVVFATLLRVAKKRAQREAEQDAMHGTGSPERDEMLPSSPDSKDLPT